jgi:hypothetical protein
MGLLFTAYDFVPFFGAAAVLVLVRRRRVVELPIALAAMAAPSALVLVVFKLALHLDWTNKNTAIYSIVAQAYLHPPALGVWLAGVSDFVPVLAANFFYANLVFLPALFLVAVFVARRPLTLTEAAVLIAGAALFCFNNLAPPYVARWQMRGIFIPRLYQPIFVSLLIYVARVVGDGRALSPLKARVLLAAAALAFVGNATIAFGPIARVPWSGYVYHRFYMHSGPGEMERQLALHGRRPLGFCPTGP